MKTYKEFLKEAEVAGDSGGSVSNIASGTTTGAITNKGPIEVSDKKRKRESEKK